MMKRFGRTALFFSWRALPLVGRQRTSRTYRWRQAQNFHKPPLGGAVCPGLSRLLLQRFGDSVPSRMAFGEGKK